MQEPSWKSLLLSEYTFQNFEKNPQYVCPRSIMKSFPPTISIEVQDNGSVVDNYDQAENLFHVMPIKSLAAASASASSSGSNASENDNKLAIDSEERDLLRRMLTDPEFFETQRAQNAFTRIIIKKRLKSCVDIITIGKSDTCTIQLEHQSVSRQHASLFIGVDDKVEDGENNKKAQPTCCMYIVDHSSNGTKIILPRKLGEAQNIISLKKGEATKLQDGDEIRIGTSAEVLCVKCESWATKFENNRNIRERQEEADEVDRRKLQSSYTDDGISSLSAISSVQLLQQLPISTLLSRMERIKAEITRITSSNSTNQQQQQNQEEVEINRLSSLNENLREIQHVLSEKQSQSGTVAQTVVSVVSTSSTSS